MSNETTATLPPLRSSSEACASVDSNRSDSSSSHGDYDTSFLQPETVNTTEVGSGDGEGKTDSKQRRKRTSPRDQAILEAEYKFNPKPSKAARAEIVAKVDLNEKEVQIWFQNRRQIQRRKQRPLLPHEIAAFGLGYLTSLSSDSVSGPIFSSSQSMEEIPESSHDKEVFKGQHKKAIESEELPEAPELQHDQDCVRVTAVNSVEESRLPPPPAVPGLKRGRSSEILVGQSSSYPVEDVPRSFSPTPGYLANRWNVVSGSFSESASNQGSQFETPSTFNPNHSSSCPERTGFSDSSPPSSQIRLSMSLDGKAELISSEPSPPRARDPRPSSAGSTMPQNRSRGLQRSQSALTFGALPQASAAAFSFLPQLPRGRSRDARSWQFACDSEARDELTTQAENESNGSAVAAISLLRSTSKSALRPNSNKRNAPPAKYDTSVNGKRPKLARAQSSLAKLQGGAAHSRPQSSNGKIDLVYSPSGDSDKENWVPQESGGNGRRRPLPTGRQDKQSYSKSVLGDNFNPPTRLTNIGVGKSRRQKAAIAEPKIFEDQESSGKVGEEVEKFMRGEVSPSKRGEFEGAQALLAMMGAWR